MTQGKICAGFDIEYRVPFPTPEATNKSTLILPVGSKRYLLDGLEKTLMLGRVNEDGTPDMNFASKGFNSHDIAEFSSIYLQSAGMVPQANGKMIAGLYTSSELGLVRFMVDGEVDKTFGQAGKVFHKFDKTNTSSDASRRNTEERQQSLSASAVAAALTPATDDKFYGILGSRSGDAPLLLRCLEDGMLDAEFNDTGIVIVKHPTLKTQATAVVATEDGGALIAGTLGDRSNGMRGFFSRLKADGSLDKAFGLEGYSVFDSVSAGIPHPELYQMELVYVIRMKDGGYAACGYLTAQNPWRDFGLLIRVDSSGQPEISFNGGKPLLFELPDGAEADFLFGGIAEMADGKLVVAGGAVTRNAGYQRQVLLVRYDSQGILDDTFGEKGWIVHSPFGDAVTFLTSLQVDAEQNVLVAGDSGPDDNILFLKGFAAQLG